MRNNPKCWVECIYCHHRDMISRAALSRRTRLKCSRCGGRVEPSDAAKEDLTTGADVARDQERKFK